MRNTKISLIKPGLLLLILLGSIWLAGCERTFQIQVALETPSSTLKLGKLVYILGGDVWSLDLDGGAPKRLTRDGYNSSPGWSASGRFLAFLKRSRLWVLDTITQQATLVNDTPVSWFAWSPKGDRLAYSMENSLVMWMAENQFAEELLSPIAGETRENFVWSADGEALFFNRGSIDAGQYRVSLEKLTLGQDSTFSLYASEDLANLPRMAQPSPDGIWLAFWRWDTVSPFAEETGLPMCVLGLVSGELNCTEEQSLPFQETFAWFKQGELALIAEDPLTAKASLMILRAGSMSPHQLVEFIDQYPLSPSWSPDGTQIAISAMPSVRSGAPMASPNSLGRRIWLVDVTSGSTLALTREARYSDERPMWSSDGKDIMFARLGEQEASLWLVQANGSNLRQIVPEMTPLPELIGEYGIVDWKALWDWWRP